MRRLHTQLRVVSPGVFVASPTTSPDGGSEGVNGPVLVHLSEGPDKVLLASALVAEHAQMPEEMLISAWETFKTRSSEKSRQLLQLPSGLTMLNSRAPHKDSTYGVYTMRFDGEGRVKAPSRKNIVMVRNWSPIRKSWDKFHCFDAPSLLAGSAECDEQLAGFHVGDRPRVCRFPARKDGRRHLFSGLWISSLPVSGNNAIRFRIVHSPP